MSSVCADLWIIFIYKFETSLFFFLFSFFSPLLSETGLYIGSDYES